MRAISRSLRVAVFVLLSLVIFINSQQSVVAPNSPLAVSVYSEDLSTSNIVSPSLVSGQSFNVSILAANLSAVSDQNSGGVSGFDIGLAYNSSILKVGGTWSTGPQCPLSDNCIFDMPANNTVTISHAIDSPPGASRIGVLVLGPKHRPDLSNLQGLPALLFRVQFIIKGIGATSISIQQASSQITGFINGCGNLIPFTVTNAHFDNRSPFAIQASPPTGSVTQGRGLTVAVNVTRTNNLGNGTVTLLLSNAVNGTGYVFSPRTGNLNATHQSFLSSLTITTAPTTLVGRHLLTIIGVLQNYPQYNLDFSLDVTSGIAPYVAGPPAGTSGHVNSAQLPNSTPLSSSSLIATFNLDSPSVIVNSLVKLSALAVWCSSSPYNLRWDFGDGSSGTGNSVSHAYSRAGTFTITLTLTDNGNTYTSSRDVTVTSPSAPSPSASLDLYSTLAVGLAGFVVIVLVLAVIMKPRRRKNFR
ncbi:MAG TPA: PKD domain-containing protein [Candidatus Bathyarchaeia archaeon]|nr:PKD domain-containing protein [Candidatus Bathyarchaeia archaeon]